jgi:hypothetical protein
MNAGSLITTGEKGKDGIRNIIPANGNMFADIYNYTNITFYNIYPDIDLVFKMDEKRQFKYDFIVHPNGKVDDIQLEYKGADNLVLNGKGELEITTKFGVLIEKIPLSWYQQANGTKEIVEVEYNLTGSSLMFKSIEKQYQTLFIDPSANLLWATYYGDSLNDSGTCLAVDSFDNIYMGGYTSSINNIATAGSYIDSLALPYDGYIVKFTNDGQRLWSTYLGGFRPNDMDMNALNQFVITSDSGIIQFNESGFPLWTYSRPNFGKALTYDPDGNVIAVGDSIIKLSSTGSFIWATDYAGTSKLNDVDCDGTGNIYVVGHTTDTADISTAGAHQANYGGGTNAWQGVGVGSYEYMVKSSHGDGMVLKLNANGEKIWGTYYGGERFDEITSIAVNDDGDFAVSGLTNSLVNISSAGSFQPNLSRNNSIIFMQFTFGGPGDTICGGLMHVGDTCVDKVYGLPYTNHYQDRDAFIVNFDQTGQRKWGTYFGVPASDYASKLIVDDDKNIYNISLNKTYFGITLSMVWDSITNTWGYNSQTDEVSLYPTDKYSYRNLPTLTNYINLTKFDSLGNRKLTSYFSGTAMPDYPCDPEFSLFQGSLAIDSHKSIFINGKTILTGGIATEGAYKTNNENVWVGPNSFAVHDAFLAKFIQGNFDTVYEPQHTTPCTSDTIRLALGITPYPLTDLNFQWYKDNEILAGKTDSILIIPNSSVSDNGYYYSTFMDNGYTWKSDSANVFTQSEPAFTKVGNDTCFLCGFPNNIDVSLNNPFEEFWTDMDNDKDLDGLVINLEKNIWMNDSTGFIKSTQNLMELGFSDMSAALADYDNDNDIDLIICGDTAGWHTPATVLYRNDDGIFNRTLNTFRGVHRGIIKWTDIDNDGDQDIIVTGLNSDWWVSIYIYENLKDSFDLKSTIMCGFISGFIEPADYDRDGDVDLLIGGSYGCGGATTSKIYNNINGNFEDANLNMEGLFYSSGKWGDYDSDGDIDIIINGTITVNGDGDSTILYRNNAGSFERITHQIPSTRNKIHFVDYDNDGDLDVIGGNRLSQNNETNFIERLSNTPEIHTGILNSHVEPGDYDNDGDVDLLGWNEVYRNDACDIYNTPNLPPSAPVSLSNVIHYDTVHFSWGEANDDKTPQLSLTYNLRVGTTPGGNQIMSSLSDATGWRKIVGMGNVQQNTSWWLKLPEGTYYWSVQAIDNSFAGGSFSTEEAFIIIKHPQIITHPISLVKCPGDSIIMQIETNSFFPLTYQWYKNNAIITGATDSIFMKLAADSSDIAQYYCKVSNSSYDTYSDTITVDVHYRPYFILDTILTQGNTQFADLDADGDLDLILNRSLVYTQGGSFSYDPKTQIYYNSNGTYSLSGSFNFNTDLGSSLISDLSCDGLPDILFYNSDSVRLFINNVGVFTQIQTSISNTNNAKVMSGDIDNDGDADLVILNRGMYNMGASVKILLNDNLNFEEITLNVRHALYGDGLLMDYDIDGDLDIFYTGFHYYWLDPTLPAGNFATILDNDQLQFTPVDQGFYALEGSSFASDINFDGKTDMLVSGTHSPGWPHSLKAFICDSTSPSGFVQQDIGLPNSKRIISVGDIDNNGFIDAITEDHIYFNINGYFSDSTSVVAGRPGDFDNNGNLDLLAGSEIYQSQSCVDQVNTPPTSPSGLSVSIVDSITHFSWSRATDSQTPQLGLSYNLRLGTSPGGSEIMSAMSNQDGYRQIVDIGNVQQNTSWWTKNLAPGTYYWSVQAIDNSFAGGPFASEQSFLVYSHDSITGTLRYNNAQNTLLDSANTIVHFSGIAIDSCLSNLSGEYQLRSVTPGSYQFTFITNKPWSGVNGTDALKIQRHFAGLETITEPVSLQAADVNNSVGINGTDAVQVKRRFAGMDASFERGDWTFAKPIVGGDTIIINGSNVAQDFYGLCVGDVNGSNTPSTGNRMDNNKVKILMNGTIEVIPGQEFDLPIKTKEAVFVNAISLVIPYPSDLLEVIDVKTKVGSLTYTAQNDEIRIAWSEIQSFNLQSGDTLILLRLKTTEQFTGDAAISLSTTSESELADERGNVIPLAELFIPAIKPLYLTGIDDQNTLLTQCSIFPNPANDLVNIEVTVSKKSTLDLEIIDMLGRVKISKHLGELLPGMNAFQLNTIVLPPGVYSVKLLLNDKNEKTISLYKLVISK